MEKEIMDRIAKIFPKLNLKTCEMVKKLSDAKEKDDIHLLFGGRFSTMGYRM